MATIYDPIPKSCSSLSDEEVDGSSLEMMMIDEEEESSSSSLQECSSLQQQKQQQYKYSDYYYQAPWLLKEKQTNVWKVAQSWFGISSLAVLFLALFVMYDTTTTTKEDRDLESDLYDPYEEDFSPLLPLTSSDYIGFICATFGLMIAAGGGIGGGGILVPVYILVMGFSPKHAIPLSNITVFGGAVANTILNAPKRHPLADRPLVDWDLILVMEPLTIGGALLGAFLNKVLPDELIVVMLVLLLSFTAYKSLTKATKMYQLETIHMNKHNKGVEVDDDDDEDEEEPNASYVEMSEQTDSSKTSTTANEKVKQHTGSTNNAAASEPLMVEEKKEKDGIMSDETKKSSDEKDGIMLSDNNNEEAALAKILEEERHVPTTNITMLVALFVVVLFINLMKGGGAFESPIGIECGGIGFWLSNALMLVWIILVSIRARSYLVQRYYEKQHVHYVYVEGDIQWDSKATIVYPLVCMLAGFFAGMFGIGGGIVKGPLMLAMGVHPAVSSASSACMILFTSFTATTSFVVFGLLNMQYAAVCLCLGFGATIVGQLGLAFLMKRYQRNSYIAFSIGVVVLLSTILMTIQGLVSLAEQDNDEAVDDTGG
eukprot:CAMPEP_0194203432 /NCGR_PEP_ID=MMETSP0156-20130528/3210_1 /TAXON_ID=33649 /ORGANISM="Thalassionema nitzschioides, Strain L26-B" /LENGTH=599 /DNA_ID=CAMNT_0038929181 /DNA_START=240 /DNA_END=2035 /DNA_ORIENTATION=+